MKISAEIEQTHEFIFSKQLYSFNLQIVSTVSQKIKNYLNQFQSQKQIPLIENEENEIELSENSIKDFISFCHYKDIVINNTNATDLNYLANEYSIHRLIDATNQYIIQHKELLLKQFLFNLNIKQSDNNYYENAISQHIDEFINDDNLLELPISSIYRILQKCPNLNNDQKFNFLLKCLKKHGKQASILFSNFDFSGSNKNYLFKIINEQEYSKIFDLSIINSEMLIALFNQQEKIIEGLNQEISKQQQEISKQKQEISKQQQEMSKQQQEISKQKQEISKQQQEISKQQQEISKQKQEFENYKKHHRIKKIHAIYIIPPKKYVNTKYSYADPFDIDFIHRLSKEDIIINVDTYYEERIIEIVKNIPNFLDLYDVLIFGNGDRRYRYQKMNYTFFDLVNKYRDNGGSILMMHDFNCAQYKDKNNNSYAIFKDDLNFNGFAEPWNPYTRCKFNPPDSIKDEVSELMTFPHEIGENQEFDVVETHETPIYDSKYKIIESKLKPNYHYYSENPSKRVADCSMGHNANLKDDEKKLLFNIIYHLSQLP